MGSFKLLTALAIGVVGGSAIAAQSVTDTMINAQIRPLITEAGLKDLENARLQCLNDGTINKEAVWKDPSHDISGAFKIEARYLNKENQPCLKYVHAIRKKDGQTIASEKTGNALGFRNIVCHSGQQWEKFEGDIATLTAEAGAPAVDASAKSGSTGPEHRREYPNMAGPSALGQLLDFVKNYKKAIEAETTAANKDNVRQQMYDWTSNSLVPDMKKNKKTLALDQLVILLGQIDGETAKFKTVQAFMPRLVLIGDAAKKKSDIENIAKLISDKSKKSMLTKALNQRPEKLD